MADIPRQALRVPAAEEASGRSPLHDVKDIGRRFCARGISALGKSKEEAGGARRDRTDDLLLAKQALSQLSYGPVGRKRVSSLIMVGLGRLELPTSRLSGVRSNRLSYRPDAMHTFSHENVRSCLKKEKRRRRKSRSSFKDPVRFLNRVRCLGRADRTGVSADPEGSSLERR
jgi:hypothetical protein